MAAENLELLVPWGTSLGAKGVCVCVFFSYTPFLGKVSCAPQHERSMLASSTEVFVRKTLWEAVQWTKSFQKLRQLI